MASNEALIAVKNHGWLNGFGNMFRKENHQWWGTWQWLVQVLIWMVIVNGMLVMVTLTAPKIETARERREISGVEADAAEDAMKQTPLMVFFIFSGMAPAVGVILIAQGAIIEERQTGTAAWVFSKPVSRPAFLLSKFCSNAIGILATMVLVQGAAAYFIYNAAIGISLPIPGFLGALGLLYLLLVFYLSLTLMLGTLFRSRGAVIGISMVLVFGNRLTGLAPWLGKLMPWNLVMDLGPDQPSLAVAMSQGQPLSTLTPILGTVVLAVVFVAIALWRFSSEEF